MATIKALNALIQWCSAIEKKCEGETCFNVWGGEDANGEWAYIVSLADCYSREYVVDVPQSLVDKVIKAVGWCVEPIEQGCYSMAFTSADLKGLGLPKFDYHTYVIEAVGTELVKIGKAYDVQKRLKQLQTSSPHTLRLIRVYEDDIEAELHKIFKEHRIRGEWFDYNWQLRSFFESMHGH